ncbi:MAG: acyltransferase family protein [Lachnospiraceae bacterium]|nr:acyltransferase family protein [Lachnospiraceae bacterium]
MGKRASNYDWLRVISAIAVIMIHVSGSWFGDITNDIAENNLNYRDIESPFWVCIYNSISRFAVPCFVMISGAFILDNEKNIEYRKFYSKSFSKIGVPTIVFSILYILYQIPLCFIGEGERIITMVKNIVKGSPMYHMWYMYMLIGLYLLVPITIRFKDSISEKNFHKITFIFLAFASLSMWTSNFRLSWDAGRSFEYLGYFMVGYSIRKICKEKNNKRATLAVLAGILFEICAAGLEYRQMVAGIAESELKYSIVEPSSPLIVLASILIFYGFTVLNIKKDVTKLSRLTLWIYLIHAGVWDFIIKVVRLTKGENILVKTDGMIWIPIFVVVVLGISCVLSKLYIWLWGKFDKEKKITNKLLQIIHL